MPNTAPTGSVLADFVKQRDLPFCCALPIESLGISTGGGAGGTVAVLGAKGAGEAFRRVVVNYARERSFEPYVFEGSSIGADRFGLRVLHGKP